MAERGIAIMQTDNKHQPFRRLLNQTITENVAEQATATFPAQDISKPFLLSLQNQAWEQRIGVFPPFNFKKTAFQLSI